MKTKAGNSALWTLIGLMLLTSSVTYAQVSFGIRAGLNATNISFDNLDNRSERLGFHAGVFTELPIAPDFMSLQPELSYSVKGAAYKPLNDRQTLNMDYLDLLLPVAFKLGPVDLQVGPFASYLISKSDYTAFNDNRVVVDAFKKFDAGLTAGLTFNFSKILLGVRYNQGFANVSNENLEAILGRGKNGVGQVSVGYKF